MVDHTIEAHFKVMASSRAVDERSAAIEARAVELISKAIAGDEREKVAFLRSGVSPDVLAKAIYRGVIALPRAVQIARMEAVEKAG